MSRTHQAVYLSFVVALSWLSGGCSQEYPATFPVTGVLTIDDVPAPNIIITYASKTGNPSAIGRTDADGKYVLTTYKPKDGAMPGECVVLLVPDDLEMGDGNLTLKELALAQKSKVPFRYFEKETSDLVVQVHSDNPNNHVLKIQSQ